MTAADLLRLAERVEKLEGPDRRLDFDLWVILTNPTGFPALSEPEENRTSWFDTWKDKGGFPRYTASLDAAMSLVPEGWKVCLCVDERPGFANVHKLVGGEGPTNIAHASTLALALTAAALRALAAQADGVKQ